MYIRAQRRAIDEHEARLSDPSAAIHRDGWVDDGRPVDLIPQRFRANDYLAKTDILRVFDVRLSDHPSLLLVFV